MRITEIEIKNFRAFYGVYQIDLHKVGKNLLVYGENGSGKTSLYQALKRFLESSDGADTNLNPTKTSLTRMTDISNCASGLMHNRNRTLMNGLKLLRTRQMINFLLRHQEQKASLTIRIFWKRITCIVKTML